MHWSHESEELLGLVMKKLPRDSRKIDLKFRGLIKLNWTFFHSFFNADVTLILKGLEENLTFKLLAAKA